VSGPRRRLIKRIPTGEGRARLPRQGRQAPCVRQQPRGQHHQPDRHADADRGGRTARPGRPRRHGPDWPTAARCCWLRAGRASSASSTCQQEGGAADRCRAARRTACGRWTMRRGSSALRLRWRCRALPPRPPAACEQAGLPELRHRPHGRGAAGGRGAEAARGEGHLLPGQRTHADRWQQPGRRTGHPGGARVPPKATPSARTPGTTVSLAGRHCPAACGSSPRRAAGRPGARADAAGYCAELDRPATAFQGHDRAAHGPIFRAPGGKTSPALLKAAAACGWTHVGWAPRAFWATNCPATATPTRNCWNRRCATSAPATCWWRTWASGRARTRGRRRCWSR
jgi:hypothetical protein